MLSSKLLEKEFNKSIYVDNGIENIHKNYITVTLGNELKVYKNKILDVKQKNETKSIIIPEEGYELEPNKLYLGRTNEYTKTEGYVPILSGLPALALQGVEIHVTAGFGDNGFEGTWTLEIVCTQKTILYPNMIIGRIYYVPLIGDPSIKYKGKYLGQIEPTESRIERDYKVKQLTTGGKNNVNK